MNIKTKIIVMLHHVVVHHVVVHTGGKTSTLVIFLWVCLTTLTWPFNVATPGPNGQQPCVNVNVNECLPSDCRVALW